MSEIVSSPLEDILWVDIQTLLLLCISDDTILKKPTLTEMSSSYQTITALKNTEILVNTYPTTSPTSSAPDSLDHILPILLGISGGHRQWLKSEHTPSPPTP